MILLQVVGAYIAASQMLEQELEYGLSHALVITKRRMQPHFEFFIEQEKKLANEYGIKDADGQVPVSANGSFTFQDAKAGCEFRRRHAELERIQIEQDWSVLKAKAPEKIKGAHLEALEGFIDFESDKQST